MPTALRTLAIVFVIAVPARGDDLAKKIEAVIDGPDYKSARWGVLVVHSKSGETVYARDPARLIVPASTTKLFSCAAALIALGPDHRFETSVYRRGEVNKAGVLAGDLILAAGGDLSFGGRTDAAGKMTFKDHDHTYANSGLFEAELTDTDPLAGLDELARQVKKAGVGEVRGEVLIDDRLFDHTRGSGSGPVAVSPVVVNDNVVDLVITPGAKAGDRAGVTMRPAHGLLQMDADVTTAPADSKPTITLAGVGPNQFTVRGRVPAGGRPLVRIYPVDDPTLFARALFIDCLRRSGVRVMAPVAKPERADLPEGGCGNLAKVATFTSPPFSEAVKVTLKVSHNLYASTLPELVAVKTGGRTAEAGLREQGKILKSLGLDPQTISFAGGAGGAPADCVTPRATVDLLRAMAKRPEWAVYKAALPSLGVDGTLVDVVPKGSTARGKVLAKTGTLIWHDAMNGRSLLRSKALAGVMTTAKGTDLTIALFVNDVPLPAGVGSSREGKVLGRVCEIIHDHGP